MRKFYVFNSLEKVKQHISQIKTLADLMQLRDDIRASGTNLTSCTEGFRGVYTIDCLANDGVAYRHVFLTKKAFEEYGGLEYIPCTVLEE